MSAASSTSLPPPQLADALSEAARGSAAVTLDLRELTFMDSSGLHAILIARARLAEGKTRPEAYRCLKRHLARRIWRLLHDLPDKPQPHRTTPVAIPCNMPSNALALT